jgi:hypothetical protein
MTHGQLLRRACDLVAIMGAILSGQDEPPPRVPRAPVNVTRCETSGTMVHA